jgi:hypothetical protein
MAQHAHSSAPPPVPGALGRELVIRLEGAARSWRRRRAGEDALRLSAAGMVLEHERCLREPLRVGYGALALAAVEPGGARAGEGEGRFPVLRRLGSTSVVPRSEGIEGWLWTSAGGSALPMLGEDGDAPNAVVLFAQPLGETVVTAAFEPELAAALAARSPLGVPAVYGLLLRVADPAEAETAFRRAGLDRPLTDREVPPTLRRHLPGDRPADPHVQVADARRAARSVPPPGMA